MSNQLRTVTQIPLINTGSREFIQLQQNINKALQIISNNFLNTIVTSDDNVDSTNHIVLTTVSGVIDNSLLDINGLAVLVSGLILS